MYTQFLECFVVIGLKMNSGDDFDMIDKVLFMIDKMFSDNYGKIIKKIKNIPSFKDDYFYYEKILKEKYPSYYERKYSNCNHRYDNKFFWVYEKNYGNDNFTQTQQIMEMIILPKHNKLILENYLIKKKLNLMMFMKI